MIEITKIAFKALIEHLEKGEITCYQIMEQALENIKKYDSVLESFISLRDEETLLKEAGESDKRREAGKQKSRIDGIPVAVKDNIHVQGIKTTCGSRILTGYNPAFDATSTEKLLEAGAIVIGKTNLDEFAMGSTCETSALKHTKNPWDTSRVPGGSSGGSAVAVAASMAPLALGSDTGGSIRQPAAFCGVVGIKPTYGLISRFGLVAYASSFDQIGTFGKDVYGAASLLNIVAGYDTKDSTSLEAPEVDYTKEIEKPIAGKKIAVLKDVTEDGLPQDILDSFNHSLDLLKRCGAEVDVISFPAIKYVISAYYFLATAEASSNLSRYDAVKYGYRSGKQADYDQMLLTSRSHGFGKEVKKRILLGNFVLSSGYYDAYYRKAQKVRTHIMEELKKIFEKYDAIALPTTPDIAFMEGETEADPLKMYLSDITTVIPNLAGIPAVSVPCGLVRNMPVGLQLMGEPLSEDALLNIAFNFEKAVKQEVDFEVDLDKLEHREVSSKKVEIEEVDHSATRYSKELIQEISSSYNKTVSEPDRTLCSGLNGLVGKKVKISGMIYRINSLGGIEFYTLRDRTGMTQLVLEGDTKNTQLSLQSVVEVEGEVTKEDRSPYDNIEIKVEKLNILSAAGTDMPINVSSNHANLNLSTVLDYRTLSVRNLRIQKIFSVQSEIVRLYTTFLSSKDFMEIRTPKIISSGTEGGTNIFELKYFDKTAFLAQSPQFYKQIMVGSGFERVFEVGPVFRAELHNTTRHLNEYTSLDFEMAYIRDEMDVIAVHEQLLKYILKGVKDKYPDILKEFNGGEEIRIPDSFIKIHFLEALEIAASQGVTNMDGDISPDGERVLCEYFTREKNNPFVYIIGYPVAKRPMYTMEDERLRGYTRSFDLLYRGLEITTGGQRIHDYETLRQSIISRGGNPNNFTDYLIAFKYGMPPHGGLGMGLERLTMQLLNISNVREATLFPRDKERLTP